MEGESPDRELVPTQVHALFDILTHHECCNEVQGLKKSKNFYEFGSPLQQNRGDESSSPLIQSLLHRFVLLLPGLQDADPKLWNHDILNLAAALADCNLSESFDKGSIGSRRTFSTAVSALTEAVSRGTIGGLHGEDEPSLEDYDVSNPVDVERAWHVFLYQAIEGDMVDRLFKRIAETNDIAEHDALIRAAHEYLIIMFVRS